MLLEVEELLGVEYRKGAVDVATLEEVTKRPGRSVTGVVPPCESQHRVGPAKVRLGEVSYRVHDAKAMETPAVAPLPFRDRAQWPRDCDLRP